MKLVLMANQHTKKSKITHAKKSQKQQKTTIANIPKETKDNYGTSIFPKKIEITHPKPPLQGGFSKKTRFVFKLKLTMLKNIFNNFQHPKTMEPIIIDSNSAHQRFDRFLRKHFKSNNNISLSDIFSRIRKGNIRINGKKAKESDILT